MFTVHPSHLSVARTFKALPANAWDLLTDTAKWSRWGPTVRGVACPERYIRQGIRGKVRTPVGWWAPFVITAYEHGRYWAWEVAGIRATGHRLSPRGSSACEVAFELPFYWAPYAVVCGMALRGMANLLEH